MSRQIKRFTDGSVLEYARGSFDDWCIYLTSPNGRRYAPKDVEYFTFLFNKAEKYDGKTIYADFVSIYNMTGRDLDENVLSYIDSICSKYDDDSHDFNIWFTVLYAAMIAEENKAYTKLGKRIKRLGIHQVLIENIAPVIAANSSKNVPWRQLDAECASRNF